MNRFFKHKLIVVSMLITHSCAWGITTPIKKSQSTPSTDVELKDAIKHSDFNRVRQSMPSFLTINQKAELLAFADEIIALRHEQIVNYLKIAPSHKMKTFLDFSILATATGLSAGGVVSLMLLRKQLPQVDQSSDQPSNYNTRLVGSVAAILLSAILSCTALARVLSGCDDQHMPVTIKLPYTNALGIKEFIHQTQVLMEEPIIENITTPIPT